MSNWTGSANAAVVASAYCVKADIVQVFGSDNVDTWADLNNNENAAEIAARVATSIELATSEVNDLLRDGPYDIPMTSPPVTIVNVTATLAGVWLYESRGVDDVEEDKEGRHRLSRHKNMATGVLNDVLAGRRKLALTQPVAAPFVVDTESSHDAIDASQ